ncbi:hypothetical protein ATCC90586_005268 [Pythium insidiosum]|nr:hypothetical protein ATCC90586_005268 [Pythium insidiosum]
MTTTTRADDESEPPHAEYDAVVLPDMASGSASAAVLATAANEAFSAVMGCMTTQRTSPSPPRERRRASERDAGASGETAAQVGARLSSHLDMLAETVRVMVTQHTQPHPSAGEAHSRQDEKEEEEEEEEDDDEEEADEETEARSGDGSTAVAQRGARGEYAIEVRQRCMELHEQGRSYRQIASALQMPVTSVQTIVKKVKQRGHVAPSLRTGRPRATDDALEAAIRALVQQQPSATAREIHEQLQSRQSELSVSFETIRRRVRECRKQLSLQEPTTRPSVENAQGEADAEPQDQHQDDDGEDDGDDDDDDDDHEDDEDVDGAGGEEYSSASNEAAAPSSSSLAAAGPDQQAAAAAAAQACSSSSSSTKAPRRKRGNEYSPEFRERCVVMHEQEGKSYLAIATELQIPQDSVRAIVRKAKRTGSVVTAPRSGRPRKTTELMDRVILQTVKTSQQSSAKQIREDLWNIYQIKVSAETIRRRVREYNKQAAAAANAPQRKDKSGDRPRPTTANDRAASAAAAAAAAAAAPIASASAAAAAGAGAGAGAQAGSAAGSSSTATATATTATAAAAAGLAPPSSSRKRKRGEHPLAVREQCVALHARGLGFAKIGEQLRLPPTTVRAIVHKMQRTGTVAAAPRSGRPRKTDEILDKVILQTVKANDKCSARMIQEELRAAFDVSVSCETIRRRVKEHMRKKHLFAEFSTEVSDGLMAWVQTGSTEPHGAAAASSQSAATSSSSPAAVPALDPMPMPMAEPAAPALREQDRQMMLQLQRQLTDQSRMQQSLMEIMSAAAALPPAAAEPYLHAHPHPHPHPHPHAPHGLVGPQGHAVLAMNGMFAASTTAPPSPTSFTALQRPPTLSEYML